MANAITSDDVHTQECKGPRTGAQILVNTLEAVDRTG